MGTQDSGRKRLSQRERFTAEEDALNIIAREAEARLAAKRAARAEAREIRMKELERQQREASDDEERMSAESHGSLKGDERTDKEDKSLYCRESGDTSASLDVDLSVRDMKESLLELEEKYRRAMVSNAQLDNEKSNLMYQVDTLRDSLMELEEQLSESRRECEEKTRELEREKNAHGVLQFQFNELREMLRQSEELLTEVRLFHFKQDGFARDITDLREMLEWKERKIRALERQKEFCQCIQLQHDDLTHEVEHLKHMFQNHGLVLNANGEADEALVGDDRQPAAPSGQDFHARHTGGDSMLGIAKEVQLEGKAEHDRGTGEMVMKQHKSLCGTTEESITILHADKVNISGGHSMGAELEIGQRDKDERQPESNHSAIVSVEKPAANVAIILDSSKEMDQNLVLGEEMTEMDSQQQNNDKVITPSLIQEADLPPQKISTDEGNQNKCGEESVLVEKNGQRKEKGPTLNLVTNVEGDDMVGDNRISEYHQTYEVTATTPPQSPASLAQVKPTASASKKKKKKKSKHKPKGNGQAFTTNNNTVAGPAEEEDPKVEGKAQNETGTDPGMGIGELKGQHSVNESKTKKDQNEEIRYDVRDSIPALEITKDDHLTALIVCEHQLDDILCESGTIEEDPSPKSLEDLENKLQSRLIQEAMCTSQDGTIPEKYSSLAQCDNQKDFLDAGKRDVDSGEEAVSVEQMELLSLNEYSLNSECVGDQKEKKEPGEQNANEVHQVNYGMKQPAKHTFSQEQRNSSDELCRNLICVEPLRENSQNKEANASECFMSNLYKRSAVIEDGNGFEFDSSADCVLGMVPEGEMSEFIDTKAELEIIHDFNRNNESVDLLENIGGEEMGIEQVDELQNQVHSQDSVEEGKEALPETQVQEGFSETRENQEQTMHIHSEKPSMNVVFSYPGSVRTDVPERKDCQEASGDVVEEAEEAIASVSLTGDHPSDTGDPAIGLLQEKDAEADVESCLKEGKKSKEKGKEDCRMS